MSNTGFSALMLANKNAMGSIYASHPVPQGNYVMNEMHAGLQGIHMGSVNASRPIPAGNYVINEMKAGLQGIHLGALSLGTAVAGEGNEGIGLLGVALTIGLGYFAFTEIMSGPKMKPARRNPRRRNGSKKGAVRNTARRAYAKSAKQKRAHAKAKKAMKLYHSGQ
ncbi:MAG: hypothetical protein GWP42_14180, partial [Verrucomicrobiales bacterium]|nr:hypothetical protein [Verrucomicrobiales bacterium]